MSYIDKLSLSDGRFFSKLNFLYIVLLATPGFPKSLTLAVHFVEVNWYMRDKYPRPVAQKRLNFNLLITV